MNCTDCVEMDQYGQENLLLHEVDDDEDDDGQLFEMTTESARKKFFYFINDTHYKEMNFSNSIEVDQFISQNLGAQHLPLSTIIPISVVYALFFLIGVFGNVSTCLVIYKNKYMQTPTNVYLANLAIADLMAQLIAMPFEMYLQWRQYPWVLGEFVCDSKMLITETVTYSSILTIVAFTTERYTAICHPLELSRRSKLARARRAAIAIWIISVSFSIPWIFYNKVNYVHNPETQERIERSAWCAVPWNEESSKAPLYLMIMSTVVGFIIPCSLVTILYCKIGLVMHRSANPTSLFSSTRQRQQRSSFRMNHYCESCHEHADNGVNAFTVKRQFSNSTPNNLNSVATSERQQQQQDCRRCNKPQESSAFSKERRAVIRMLVVVVLVFFLCWTPFHAQRLLFVVVTLRGGWNRHTGYAHYVLYLASGVGYYLSSSVNPLLYSVFSRRFRRGFTNMIKGAKSTGGGPGQQQQNHQAGSNNSRDRIVGYRQQRLIRARELEENGGVFRFEHRSRKTQQAPAAEENNRTQSSLRRTTGRRRFYCTNSEADRRINEAVKAIEDCST